MKKLTVTVPPHENGSANGNHGRFEHCLTARTTSALTAPMAALERAHTPPPTPTQLPQPATPSARLFETPPPTPREPGGESGKEAGPREGPAQNGTHGPAAGDAGRAAARGGGAPSASGAGAHANGEAGPGGGTLGAKRPPLYRAQSGGGRPSRSLPLRILTCS